MTSNKPFMFLLSKHLSIKDRTDLINFVIKNNNNILTYDKKL